MPYNFSKYSQIGEGNIDVPVYSPVLDANHWQAEPDKPYHLMDGKFHTMFGDKTLPVSGHLEINPARGNFVRPGTKQVSRSLGYETLYTDKLVLKLD